MSTFKKSVEIMSSPSTVWDALTNPELIPLWMGDPEMNLNVITTWRIGDAVTITGTHHEPFINTGKVLAFDPEQRLCYTHLSSVSDLPDVPTNHTRLCFDLAPLPDSTVLTLTMENFPTEVIFKHMEFYWSSTLELFRQFVEANQSGTLTGIQHLL